MRAVIAAALLLLSTSAAARGSAPLVECAAADGRFGALVGALKASGLAVALSEPGPFTLFAPTDSAFAELPPGRMEALMAPSAKAELIAFLGRHVLPGRVESGRIPDTLPPNMAGTQMKLAEGDNLVVNGVATGKPIQCGNGVIHPIDSLLRGFVSGALPQLDVSGRAKPSPPSQP